MKNISIKKKTYHCFTVLLLAVFLIVSIGTPLTQTNAQLLVFDVALNPKAVADMIATGAAKIAIRTLRDMVLRWIITGNFEGPVFVTSFSVDAAKVAENASRIFLSGLTDINFCTFIGPPPISTFSISADFGLSCTLPSTIGRNYTDTLIKLAFDPGAVTIDERLALRRPENVLTTNYIRLNDERERAIAGALIARSAEYVAGQGFLGIRDPRTGKIRTPGTAVAEQVKVSQIVAPYLGAELADDVQSAIVEIIDTAVRVVIEKGLTQAFGSEP